MTFGLGFTPSHLKRSFFVIALSAIPAFASAESLPREVIAPSPAATEFRGKLDRITLPLVEFRDASAPSALQFIREKLRDISPPGMALTLTEPTTIDHSFRASISLRDVSLARIIDSICASYGWYWRLTANGLEIHSRDGDFRPK